jgi:flagellar FliJ protein
MQQSRATRLAPVVDMAERAEREAARALGRSQTLLLQAEGKQGELQRYLGDYQQQWLTQGQQGVSGQWLMGYQRFLSQLETAIGQQRQAVQWHLNSVNKARDLWQQRYARLEGLRKLVQRYQQEARAIEDRREQKMLDELAQRLTLNDTQRR